MMERPERSQTREMTPQKIKIRVTIVMTVNNTIGKKNLSIASRIVYISHLRRRGINNIENKCSRTARLMASTPALPAWSQSQPSTKRSSNSTRGRRTHRSTCSKQSPAFLVSFLNLNIPPPSPAISHLPARPLGLPRPLEPLPLTAGVVAPLVAKLPLPPLPPRPLPRPRALVPRPRPKPRPLLPLLVVCAPLPLGDDAVACTDGIPVGDNEDAEDKDLRRAVGFMSQPWRARASGCWGGGGQGEGKEEGCK